MINKGERDTLGGIYAVLKASETGLLELAADAGSSPAVRAEVAATAGRLNAIEQMIADLIAGAKP